MRFPGFDERPCYMFIHIGAFATYTRYSAESWQHKLEWRFKEDDCTYTILYSRRTRRWSILCSRWYSFICFTCTCSAFGSTFEIIIFILASLRVVLAHSSAWIFLFGSEICTHLLCCLLQGHLFMISHFQISFPEDDWSWNLQVAISVLFCMVISRSFWYYLFFNLYTG